VSIIRAGCEPGVADRDICTATPDPPLGESIVEELAPAIRASSDGYLSSKDKSPLVADVSAAVGAVDDGREEEDAIGDDKSEVFTGGENESPKPPAKLLLNPPGGDNVCRLWELSTFALTSNALPPKESGKLKVGGRGEIEGFELKDEGAKKASPNPLVADVPVGAPLGGPESLRSPVT
jgi:hypothetical protein